MLPWGYRGILPRKIKIKVSGMGFFFLILKLSQRVIMSPFFNLGGSTEPLEAPLDLPQKSRTLSNKTWLASGTVEAIFVQSAESKL